MGPLLLLETSTRSPSMLLAVGPEVLELRYPEGVTITQALAYGPKRLLTGRGLKTQEISSVGAGLGPGSYTGLRCGLAWAKGLAAARGDGVELLGIPSLLACAIEAARTSCIDGLVIATANAYQNDVYLRAVLFDEGRVRDSGADEVLPEGRLPERIKGLAKEADEVTVLGFGCGILKESGNVSGRMRLVEDTAAPTARALYRTLESIGRHQFVCDIEGLRPVYLRPSGAEMKRERKRKGKA